MHGYKPILFILELRRCAALSSDARSCCLPFLSAMSIIIALARLPSSALALLPSLALLLPLHPRLPSPVSPSPLRPSPLATVVDDDRYHRRQ